LMPTIDLMSGQAHAISRGCISAIHHFRFVDIDLMSGPLA
jgi:hypothetical protein